MWNLLFLCLGIAIGSGDKGGQPLSRREALLILQVLLAILGAISFAGAILFALMPTAEDLACGALYNPCGILTDKWAMVALMGGTSIAATIANVVLVWMRAVRGE